MKKTIWKVGILCLLCLMLGGCGTEKTEEAYDEEQQTLLFHKVDIALDFGMLGGNIDHDVGRHGGPYLTHIARNMLDKEETYENVYLYAERELAYAAIERGEIGERDVYAYPTEKTLQRLEVLNLYIERDNLADKLDTYDLEYPVTLDDLLNKTELFWQFVNDRSLISQTSFNVIVNR